MALHVAVCIWLVLAEASKPLDFTWKVLVYVLERSVLIPAQFCRPGELGHLQQMLLTCIPSPGFCFYNLSELLVC